MNITSSNRAERLQLTRHVAHLFACEPTFRELITAVDEDGERLIICVLPTDSAGYLFDQLEARGRPGNVVMPLSDVRLPITYWTCTESPMGEMVECSDESTVEMVLQCADIASANGAEEVSFQRHAGMQLAGGREYALAA